MKNKVLGFIVNTNKEGRTSTTVYLQTEFDEYRKSNASKCVGVSCAEEFFFGDISDKLKVGAEVIVIYNKGYQGKARAVDIIPA